MRRCAPLQDLAAADAPPAAAEAGVVVAEASAPPASAAPAPAGAAEFTALHDDTLAYSFEYPVTTGEGRQLSWVFTREPMRCATAPPRRAARAPLTRSAAGTRPPRHSQLTRGSASCARCVPARAVSQQPLTCRRRAAAG